jgi:hypothetical protein
MFKKMLDGSWKESAPTGTTPTETTPTETTPTETTPTETTPTETTPTETTPTETTPTETTPTETTPMDKTPTIVEASSETLDSVTSLSPVAASTSEAPQVSAVREISTTGWDVHAFITVLRIIHGCNRQVPQAVSLSFFIDVAVIVDYYECADAVAIAANLWKQTFLGPTKLPIGGKMSIMWLWITWVFSWPSDFTSAAYREVRNSEGLDHVDTHDLPVAMLLGM